MTKPKKPTIDLLYKPIRLADDKDGSEVWVDGGVPEHTKNKDYFTCRKEAHALGLELLSEEQFREACAANPPEAEELDWSWLESGDNPSAALNAYWRDDKVFVRAYYPRNPAEVRGARRLLRVKKLDLEPSPSLPSLPLTGMPWQSEYKVSNPHEQLARVLEFLYTHDGNCKSREDWREQLIAKLKEVLGVSEDTNS